jgi:hypothetical protein
MSIGHTIGRNIVSCLMHWQPLAQPAPRSLPRVLATRETSIIDGNTPIRTTADLPTLFFTPNGRLSRAHTLDRPAFSTRSTPMLGLASLVTILHSALSLACWRMTGSAMDGPSPLLVGGATLALALVGNELRLLLGHRLPRDIICKYPFDHRYQ